VAGLFVICRIRKLRVGDHLN